MDFSIINFKGDIINNINYFVDNSVDNSPYELIICLLEVRQL